MKLPARLFFLLSWLSVLSIAVLAQPRKPAPTLTTDDVIAARPATPLPAPAASNAPGKDAPAAAAAATQPTPSSSAEAAEKAAEKEWNERLRQAQEKARGLVWQADKTDLLITQLRNQLFSANARSPETQGQINAQIAQLSAQARQLRAEAKTAQQAIETLQSEGKTKQYQAQSAALTNDKGEPDKQAFQEEYNNLQSELQAAQARLEVLQLRLTSNQADTLKKGNGDNFTLNRLRQEKEQTATELADTRAKIEALTNQLQTHRQKAAAAGVSLTAQ
jgi:chromosome segregation ATPase